MRASDANPVAATVTDADVVAQLKAMVEIAEAAVKLTKLPREAYAERERITKLLTEARANGRLLGDYESLLAPEDKKALGQTMREAVTTIFGKEAVEGVLLKGIKNPQNSIEHRIRFLKFLATNLVSDHGKRAFRRFEGEYDPKKASEAAVLMESLYTEKGVELYKAALKEEGESAAFRLALAYRATQYIKGSKLQKLLYMWNGGASGSGKSYGAMGVINMLLKHLPNFGQGDQQGNYFVFVDGGVARLLSQVRKLGLKIALRCGFSAVEDLNDVFGRLESDPIDLKKIVHQLAVASGRVSIMIPDTFSDCVMKVGCPDIDDAEKLTREKGMIHVFCEVLPPEGKTEEFKNALVPRMASERACSQEFGKELCQRIQVNQLNDKKLPCESKAPPSVSSIGFGLTGTAKAREVFLKWAEKQGRNGERYPRIHAIIVNGLVYLDYLGLNNSLRISATDFVNYQKALANMPTQQLAVKEWYARMENQGALAPPFIIMDRFEVDVDRAQFFSLINAAGRAAGLTQPALDQSRSSGKARLRESQSLIEGGASQREQLIRDLADYACVLASKTDIPSASRAEMSDLLGKRICQLLDIRADKRAPVVGAEVFVVREDCRQFEHWIRALDAAIAPCHTDVQHEARLLLIKEWKSQILQSQAVDNEKAQALGELLRIAEPYLTTPDAKPTEAVKDLLSAIRVEAVRLSGGPVAPPRARSDVISRAAVPPTSQPGGVKARAPQLQQRSHSAALPNRAEPPPLQKSQSGTPPPIARRPPPQEPVPPEKAGVPTPPLTQRVPSSSPAVPTLNRSGTGSNTLPTSLGSHPSTMYGGARAAPASTDRRPPPRPQQQAEGEQPPKQSPNPVKTGGPGTK